MLSSNPVWLVEFTEHLPNAVSQGGEAHGCQSLLQSPGFNIFDFKRTKLCQGGRYLRV